MLCSQKIDSGYPFGGCLGKPEKQVDLLFIDRAEFMFVNRFLNHKRNISLSGVIVKRIHRCGVFFFSLYFSGRPSSPALSGRFAGFSHSQMPNSAFLKSSPGMVPL